MGRNSRPMEGGVAGSSIEIALLRVRELGEKLAKGPPKGPESYSRLSWEPAVRQNFLLN